MGQVREYLDLIKNFSGFASPGSVIGAHMLLIARKVLDFEVDEEIYVTCETTNCLPDAFQAICKSTIGNGRLNILDTGKMAVIINRKGMPGETVQALRIILDPEKTVNYPIIHEWYMNTRKVSAEEVNPELIRACENLYSWYFVDVIVPEKEKKIIEICNLCNEPFIKRNELDLCPACLKR